MTMKRHALFTAECFSALMLLTIALATPARAVLVEYTGNELASSPWGTVGSSYSIDNLNQSISLGGAIWTEQPGNAVGSQWNLDQVSGSITVDFEITEGTATQLYATGLAFYLGTREWNVLINEGAVTVNGSTAVPAIEAGVRYTLLFNYDAIGMDVSLDGNPLAALQDVASLTNGYAPVIYLHRFTSSVATDSVATYYNVNWTAVPEPSSVALMALAGGAWFCLHRRKRKAA